MVSDENERDNDWKRFLKYKAGQLPVKEDYQKIFVTYYCDRECETLKPKTRKTVCTELFPSITKEAASNLSRNSFTPIFKFFKITGNNPAEQLFLLLKEDFKDWQPEKQILDQATTAVPQVEAPSENQQESVEQSPPDREVPSVPLPSTEIPEIDPYHKLNEFLLYLNYEDEEKKFRAAVKKTNSVCLYLEIDGYQTQRWLANRFMAKTPTLKEAYDRGIEASPQWMSDIGLFWQRLVKIETYEPDYNQDIIEKFCQNIPRSNQSILIAIYNVDVLRKEELDSILENFWKSFNDTIQSPDIMRKCVLLLMGKSNWIEEMNISLPKDDPSKISFKVAKKLKEEDIEELSMSMGDFCTTCCGMSPQQFAQSFNSEWLRGGTCKSLNIICSQLKLQKGFSELEQYWRVSL